MRVRSWPLRPFKLKNVGVVGWCLLAAVLLLPSRQEGAPVDSAAEPSQPAQGRVGNTETSHTEKARAVGAYGELPLGFEANQGQTDSRVRFLSHGSGYSLFLTPHEAVLALQTRQTLKAQRKANGLPRAKESEELAAPAILRMQLVGSNAAASMMGLDELPGKSNYFVGHDPARWRTNVPNYRKVAENGIYPGINLVYYGNQRQLEYDFLLAPGADPHAIRLAVRGAKQLRIDSQGNLIASVGKGDVSFQRPVAYQEDSHGARQPVAARYSIKGGRNVEFKLGKHDPSRSLVIDPTLAYSTYVGGSLIDGANGIAVAPDDSAFITGETFSTDYPTVDALFGKSTGGEVAFVSKISPDGSALLYSTYLGCSPTMGYAIAVDSLGEAYVTGTTMCPGFPTTEGTPQSWCADDNKCGATWNPPGATVFNGFVSKLNVEGTALLYSTFVGDYSMCAGRGIAVDGAQSAYVTGDVSTNFMETVPLTPPELPPPLFCHSNGFQTTLGGSGGDPHAGIGTDAFLLKIDPQGSQYLYCTYIGGSDEDVGFGVAVDTAANAYVTGVTYSSDFPTGGGALQTTYAGAGDAFLTKVNTDVNGAASLVFSTYLGGSGLDQGNGVAVDTSGNAFVAGLTTSRASSLLFTPPPGAYQTDCALDTLGVCEGDAFVAKIALSGAPSLTYFTYLGGSLADSANGIGLDSSDDAYVAGSTTSTNFPIVGVVPQSLYGGGNADAFVTELNAAGSALVYSTYIGGSATDIANGIAVDSGSPASAYAAGQTCSFDFPLANPLQSTYGGNCDAFVSKVSFLEGIALNPSGLLFPNLSLGSSSQPETVTLTNGDITLTIDSITITGAASSDFAETNNCGTTVPPGGQCTITVTFTPTALGVRKASIELIDSALGSPQFVSLTGSTSTVGISPSALAFGNQQVSVASATQPVTITNIGSSALTVSSVTASGAFSQTNDCTPTPLQPTANCVINVSFDPIAPGPNVGALTITDSAPGSPQVVLLTGTGVAGPAVTLSAISLTFPAQGVGTVSAAQAVNLSNSGGSPLIITSVTTTGDFAQGNSCGTSVAPGAVCTISITFTPSAAGNRYGAVTITDNASNSPQTISLSGTGGPAPAATFFPASLAFSTQIVNTTSAPQAITLTNTGAAALSVTAVAASANFTETNNCVGTVAIGANCTINVTFAPTAQGALAGTISVTDNAPSSPQTAPLSGTGQLGPVVSLSPTTLTFVDTSMGTTSSAQSVQLSNIGSAALNITGVTVTGDFAQTNNCGVTVPAPPAANNYCTISVTFTPTASGNRYGSVSIADNASNSPQTILIAGNSTAAAAVAFLPSSLTFASQTVNTTSGPQDVVLTNSGGAALTITSIVASGDFAESNSCPPPSSTLASGASCTIAVTFTPLAVGPLAGAITVTDNAPGSPQTVPLSGTGGQAPLVSLAPSSLTFPGQVLGSTSAAEVVTLTNTGTANLSITSIAASGDFAELNNCGSSVAPSGTCTITVTFTPAALGNRYGTVTIMDNAANSPQTIILSGSGLATPVVTLSATSLTFASQSVGSTSPIQTVTLSNTGSSPLTITSIVTTGDFSQTNSCGTSLAAGATCAISIAFTPTVAGSRTGTLTITDNAATSPQIVSLGGSGSDFAISVTPTSASVVAGNSVSYTVTVTPSFGFNAKVTLSCTGAVPEASCSVSPSAVTPDGTDSISATVTVTTTVRSMLPPGSGPKLNLPRLITRVRPVWFLWLLLLLTLLASQVMARRRGALLRLALVMGLVLLWAACLAGGTQVNTPQGTPAGNYVLTLTGTTSTAAVSHSTTANLTVQ